MNTLFVASAGKIDVLETGRYELKVNDTLCVADVRRSATLTR